MPEGPEVRCVVDKLRSHVKNKYLLNFEIFRFTNNNICKTHREIINKWDMIGHGFPSLCLDIISRGKQIYFFFENGICINSSLGMEGHWYLNQSGEYTDFSLTFCTFDGANYTIDTKIYYDDQCRFGNILITTWDDSFKKMIEEYGPDFLNVNHPITDINEKVKARLPPEYFVVPTIEKFYEEMTKPRRGKMLLCKFLLSHQEYFCGVGNWILNEVCYYSKIHPNRALGDIKHEEINELFKNIINVISSGYQCGGLTHGTFLDPDKMKGKFQTAVYKKDRDPYGNIITQVKLETGGKGRTGYVVLSLQK